MAKKTTTTKTAVMAKRSVKPIAKIESNGAAQPSAAKAKKPVKAAPVKQAPARKAVTPRAKKTAYSPDDIALRAYFIAEKRQQLGFAGDSHSDWIEAERQLLAESRKKAKSNGA